MFDQIPEAWVRPSLPGWPAASPRLRLFCLPHAGGGASLFRRWPQHLPAGVEVCPIQLPGRESRLSEPPFTRLALLVQVLARILRPWLDRPFAIFGYSFGSLVAFELARQLRWQDGRTPAHLFLAAYPAPHLPRPHPPLHHLPDPAFLDGVRRLGGLPAAILQDPELMGLFLPALRADFEVHETYTYRAEPPFDCPITVFGGLQDHHIDQGQLAAWRVHTRGTFQLSMLPGRHFFIEEQWPAIVRDVGTALAPCLVSPEFQSC